MSNKTILILGGGVGGIVAANELRRHLGRGHRIIIVDKNRIQTLGLSFLWIMVGWRKAYAIERDLSLLEKKGIEFLHASITAIDVQHKCVETEKGKLAYDYLIIALGAEYAWDAIPGLDGSVNTFYTLGGAEDIYRWLRQSSGRRCDSSSDTISLVVCSMPYKCPPAPYEAALLIDSVLRRKPQRKNTIIRVFIPEDTPMKIAGREAAQAMKGMLESRGIELVTGRHIRSYDRGASTVQFESGETVANDFTIFIPPHRSPQVVRDAGLTDQSGWIPVDKHMLTTARENVYAVGDVTTIPLASGLVLPKAGIFAMNEAEVVAYNVAQKITGGKLTRLWHWGKERRFDGAGYCFIEIGNGKAGYVTGQFYAEPMPKVAFHEPNSTYHWGKVVFEKYWLWRWF